MTYWQKSKAGFLFFGWVGITCLPAAFSAVNAQTLDANTGLLEPIPFPGSNTTNTQATEIDPITGVPRQVDVQPAQEIDLLTTTRDIDAAGSTNDQVRQIPVSADGLIVNEDDVHGSTVRNLRAAPTQSATGQNIEQDPFAPSGFRLGIFNGTATLEQSAGYSNNVSEQVEGESGAFSQTDFSTTLTSDFSRHQWQTSINGSYRRPFNGDEPDQLQFLLNNSLRLDLADGYTLTGTGFYNAQTEPFFSNTVSSNAVDTPLQETFGGSLELARTDRKFQFRLRGEIQREVNEDIDIGGGLTQSQADLDQDLYQATLRLGYEVSPAMTPYVEAVYGQNEFDQSVDRNGNRRDSEIFEIRGGLEIDLGEKLTGEMSVGYVTETFEDPQLQDLEGFTFNGSLVWSPQRDSTLTASFSSDTTDSVTLNDNGSIQYNARLDYDRQISARMGINAFVDYQTETDDTNDTTTTLGVGTVYFLNRNLALTTNLEYLRFTSDDETDEFDELSGRIGIRLQK